MSTTLDIAGFLLWAALGVGIALGIGCLIVGLSAGARLGRRVSPRWLLGLVRVGGVVLTLAAFAFGLAVHVAHGAPGGVQQSPIINVREVGDCTRPATGFGLVENCEVIELSYHSVSGPVDFDHPSSVASGDAIRPGDRLVRYTGSRWESWLPAADGPRWRPVEDADKPDLAWLPIVCLLAAVALALAASQAVGRRGAGSVDVDPDQALRGSG